MYTHFLVVNNVADFDNGWEQEHTLKYLTCDLLPYLKCAIKHLSVLRSANNKEISYNGRAAWNSEA